MQQECRNPGHRVAWATKFCSLALNILVSSVRVTLLMSRIFRSLLDFWKTCGPLAYSVIIWL